MVELWIVWLRLFHQHVLITGRILRCEISKGRRCGDWNREVVRYVDGWVEGYA